MQNRISIVILIVILSCFIGCKQSVEKSPGDTILDVAIPSDPQRLHPILRPSATARLVHQYIFLNCGDYHPETLELYPVLLDEIPQAEYIDDVQGRKVRFNMKFKPDAVWDDGTPITGKDYLFTVKMISHPLINANAYRSYTGEIESIIVDEEQPKSFTVTFATDYMLSLETAVTLPIFPAHIYDPDDHLIPYTLDQLRDREFIESETNSDSTFVKYIEDVNGMKYSRDVVVNNGPYQLDSWTTNQSISISAKPDYWGTKYPDNPFLQQGPPRMDFFIIPDQTTALSQLKDGSIDVVNYLSSKNYVDLRDNPTFNEEFQFFNPVMRRYYYMAMNNADPILGNVEVRKAMGHLLEVDEIINNIDYGMGKRVVSIVHPDRSYYNDELQAPEYDLEKAKEILTAAGWKDSDGDGDLDKVIDGANTDLEIEIYVTQSELGRQVALMLQQNAEKIGIRINITTKEFRTIMSEHVRKRDYGITPLVVSQDLNDDDFYNRWHSDSDDPRKSNHLGYRDSKADELILAIRNANNSEERYELYQSLQEVIHEDYPAIFLYAPMEKIVVSNRWNGSATVKRPGYLGNTFEAL